MKYLQLIILVVLIFIGLWCYFLYKKTSYGDAVELFRYVTPVYKYLNFSTIESLKYYLNSINWSYQYDLNKFDQIYNIKNDNSILVGDIRKDAAGVFIFKYYQSDGREMNFNISDNTIELPEYYFYDSNGVQVGTLKSDTQANSFDIDLTRPDRKDQVKLIPFSFKWNYTNILFK